ncbi:MAG: magnesium-translocating P-type ATPase [Oscillospiraceae bacterium]|nr:magnesium-translocating P-type ATPase [Oscillospiraceae bacterium]
MNIKSHKIEAKKKQDVTRLKEVSERLTSAAMSTPDDLLKKLNSRLEGLSEEMADESRSKYGSNMITHGKKESLAKRVFKSFADPFTGVLIALAGVSAFTDIIMPAPGEANPMTVIIITAMILISGVLRFVQETRSGQAAENLLKMITTTTNVKRQDNGNQEIPLEDVVVGDLVNLAAGDMIPADMRIIRAKDLFISQSALTGESVSVEKTAHAVDDCRTPIESTNLAFMGTDVISGSAMGIVLATGNDTVFGELAKSVGEKPIKTSFDKGVSSVSWLLIRFMAVMVPVVLLINGLRPGGSWMEAVLFALAIAVGLTPEMLPMIVTSCLARGAVAMSKEKTIIKNLNSIQNLGSMDVLCTDKTGTLTQDKVVLQYHLNLHGVENLRVLRHAFLNSYYQTGMKDLIDIAVITKTQEQEHENEELHGLSERYKKVDEIPFDFERRRMSVVVEDNKTQLITKGAVEEMLSISSFAEFDGEVVPLSNEIRAFVLKKVNEFNEKGFRVIAVAQKTNPSPVGAFSVADESDMVLMGYLAFLDPPKESAFAALKALDELGVNVKVLTGDNDQVTRYVCKQVGLSSEEILLGPELEGMTDDALGVAVEQISVFAKLSPQQKERIIVALRKNGHSVGYMGDGINDAPAMKAADVGISVDTAVDIAKESATVILLEKDLMVLEKGIIEGRKTYANMIKYIKMTASSNFGNMFAVLIAGLLLPFMPMLPIHLLLLNLIYDFSCIAIPWDNVDKEYISVPRKWDASSVGKFMLWLGPTSSIFDITTFALLYFIIGPAVVGQQFHEITDTAKQALFIAVFHAGWFVESMWSQTLIIHMLRTPKIPFIQSRASAPLTLISFAGIAVLTAIPFTEIGTSIGLAALPWAFFPWLALTVIAYMAVMTIFKKIYIKRYGELL